MLNISYFSQHFKLENSLDLVRACTENSTYFHIIKVNSIHPTLVFAITSQNTNCYYTRSKAKMTEKIPTTVPGSGNNVVASAVPGGSQPVTPAVVLPPPAPLIGGHYSFKLMPFTPQQAAYWVSLAEQAFKVHGITYECRKILEI